MTGCDTTSAFYNKGKKSVLNYLKKNHDDKLTEAINYFYRENANKQDIFENGIICLLRLYKAPTKIKCINELRYVMFSKAVLKKKTKLCTLPPTSDTARQHFFRVYYQIQLWLS